MAKFTANQRVDTRHLDQLFVSTDTSTLSYAADLDDPMHKFYIYPGNDIDVTFRGHDFEYTSDGYIRNGVISSVEIGHNPDVFSYVVDFKLQGLNYDLSEPQSSENGRYFGGRDVIVGSKFGDRIDGFDGSDKLTGRAGSDTFYFTTEPNATNIDRITDFSHGHDKIALDTTIFQGLTQANLSATFHDIASSAEQHDDRILYNHKNGWLFYDADGAGGQAPVHFATLNHAPTLNAHDFTLL